MNPFQLTGGSFLLFFTIFAIAVLVGLRWWFRYSETLNAPAQQNLTDPYLIAHLRGGANEALRVATVSLLDRGLLIGNGEILTTKNTEAMALANRPIEKAILKHYSSSGAAYAIFEDTAAKNACDAYEKVLKDQNLLADVGTYARRLVAVGVAVALLVGVCWAKVSIAFSQGRHNVGFLIMLTLLFSGITLMIWRRRRTGLGDAMLNDLRSLFSRLKGRAKALRAGGQTNEAALLAGVFGLAALPAASFPFMDNLYPARASSGSGCGTSSSSSCSSGSSCSGGCGGGGCGG